MAPERIGTQHAVALGNPDTVRTATLMPMRMGITVTVFLISLQLIGACFTRHPPGSTERYTRWCNTLTPLQLYTQVRLIYTIAESGIVIPLRTCTGLHCVWTYHHHAYLVLFKRSVRQSWPILRGWKGMLLCWKFK